MTGITYFCTDSHGNTYNRYSAGHAKPRYFFAVVSRGLGTIHPVPKSDVAYTSRQDLANAALTQCHKWPGEWEAEVLKVRAYQGRHKVEPTTDELCFDPVTGLTYAEGHARAQALREGRFANAAHEFDALRPGRFSRL